jgi:Uma2 family endonuclease
MTAQELLGLPDDGKRYELVKGELRETIPAGVRHGSVAARLTALLGQHVRAESLGIVLAAESGFTISRGPDTVRAPDTSFVARERVPGGGPPEGYWDLAPDLVVEAVSSNDTASEVQIEGPDVVGVRSASNMGRLPGYPLRHGLRIVERGKHSHHRRCFKRG